MLCPKCGRNVDGDNFCPNCGTPIAEYQSSDSLLHTDAEPKISQHTGSGNTIFIFGILANVFNVLYFLIVMIFSFLGSFSRSKNTYVDFHSLDFWLFCLVFSVLPIAALVLSIIGKMKASNYIRTYDQYPPKVRTGRILFNIAMPFSIVMLVGFLILVPLLISNFKIKLG